MINEGGLIRGRDLEARELQQALLRSSLTDEFKYYKTKEGDLRLVTGGVPVSFPPRVRLGGDLRLPGASRSNLQVQALGLLQRTLQGSPPLRRDGRVLWRRHHEGSRFDHLSVCSYLRCCR